VQTVAGRITFRSVGVFLHLPKLGETKRPAKRYSRLIRTSVLMPPLYASYWRTLGMDVEEHVWTAAETRSDEARSHFPGFDTTAGGVIGTLEQPPSSAANNWIGNRGGYDNPRSIDLVRAFKSSIAQ